MAKRKMGIFAFLLDKIKNVGKRVISNVLAAGPIPKHLAIIMDGNRRYAKREKIHNQNGHEKGFERLYDTLFFLLDLGVKNVSVYAFSIDNFKRSKNEVDDLMYLALVKFEELLKDIKLIHKYRVKVLVSGNIDLLPPKVQDVARRLGEATKHHSQHILNICFAYTGSYDIANAVSSICEEISEGSISLPQISSRLVEEHLLTREMPKVDLLLRTSGETRLSDFLIWQCNAAHIAFIDTLWPDLSFWDIVKVILDYQMVSSDQREVCKRLLMQEFNIKQPIRNSMEEEDVLLYANKLAFSLAPKGNLS